MSDLSAMDGLKPLGAKIRVLSIESNVKRFVEDTSYGFYSLTNEVKPRRTDACNQRIVGKHCFLFLFS